MAFRFIHTGDLHLDSPLRSLRASDDGRALVAADASRRAFVRLVDVAIERRVDAFLIAGDLWDGDWTDMDAGLMVAREAARLRKAGIPVVAILGNHDAAAASVTAHVRRLDAIHVLAEDAPESVDIGPAVVHGQSFESPAVTRNLVAHYPAPVAGRVNVGLLHTGLDGKRGHSGYAPCSVGELAARGYDYFALAHVHTREVLLEGPASAGGTAAFCGVLQGRHVREVGQKGAYLVTIPEAGAPAQMAPIDLPFVAWQRVEVDVSADEVPVAMAAALERAASGLPAALELAVTRVALVGETARHAALSSAAQSLREAALVAVANADPRFLLEEVRVETRAPTLAAPLPRLGQHFEGDLSAAAAADAVRAEAAESVRDILAALPNDVRRALLSARPDVEAFAQSGEVADLLGVAALGLGAQLREED